MNIHESDLFYEKAGENEAMGEELLTNLQKKRSDCLTGAIRILGAVMILGVLAFLLLLYPVFTPTQRHPVLDWVSAHFQSFIMGVGLLFLILTTSYLLPAVYYDHRIKMLLLLRGKRKARP